MERNNTTIYGHWYKAGSSTRTEAVLEVQHNKYNVLLQDSVERNGLLADLSVSDRVGNITRRFSWPDGCLFETADNDSVDLALKSAGLGSGMPSVTHRMESSRMLALFSVVFIALIGFATYKWGIPVAADRIARAMPVAVNETVSKGALKTMDRIAFEPSTIDPARQQEIEQLFTELTVGLEPTGFNYRLYFRKLEVGDFTIPNAMALPGGEIIVTDAFVDLVEDPGEIASVLLHELGHVVERHGMRQVIQASAISVIASMTLGNLGGVNELITGVPVFLLQSNYSRSSETAADEFAFTHMTRMGIDPIHFANIINKLGNIDPTQPPTQESESGSGYLSTHPGTRERAQKAMEYSIEFNK